MRRTDYKGKRVKRKLNKCKDVFKAFDDVQNALGDSSLSDQLFFAFICNRLFLYLLTVDLVVSRTGFVSCYQ